MKKILILLPKNTTGRIIMDGLANGFELNKCRVLKKIVNKLTSKDVENFKPDVILGYDYSFLEDENCAEIIKNLDCKNLVFYFVGEDGWKPTLDEKLRKIKSKIFISDRTFKNKFKNGIYLPLAVNSKKYETDFSGYKYSVSFVGKPLTDNRQNILCELVKVFKDKLAIFANEKDFMKSIEEIKGKRLLDENDLITYSKCRQDFVESEENIAQIYNSSKINLNICSQLKSSINYRIFEVLASGGFLLTDERKNLEEYFEISKHLETYKNTYDLVDKADFYLKNLNIAQKIANSGKIEVTKKHTFSARAKSILSSIF